MALRAPDTMTYGASGSHVSFFGKRRLPGSPGRQKNRESRRAKGHSLSKLPQAPPCAGYWIGFNVNFAGNTLYRIDRRICASLSVRTYRRLNHNNVATCGCPLAPILRKQVRAIAVVGLIGWCLEI